MENMFLQGFKPDVDNVTNRLIKLGLVPHDPRQIVYKYRSIKWAKLMLQKCVLTYSSTDAFTDELEFDFNHFDFSISEKDMKNKLYKAMERNNPNQDIVERIHFCGSKTVREFQETYKQLLLRQKMNTPVLCTCTSFEDETMWNEYADQQSGVCIGFMIPPIIPSIDLVTMNVNYIDKIKPINIFQDSDDGIINPDVLFYWMFTKRSQFKGEQEIRSVMTSNDKQYFTPDIRFMELQYYPHLFKEIYFGVNCSQKDIDDILYILEAGKYNMDVVAKMSYAE